MTDKETKTAADVLGLVDALTALAVRPRTQAVEPEMPLAPEPVRTGADTATASAMLTAQAQNLDALFVGLTARAAKAEDVRQADMILRLALKAQAQCANTLRILGDLKQPRVVAFVRDDPAE